MYLKDFHILVFEFNQDFKGLRNMKMTKLYRNSEELQRNTNKTL